jgi:hypothetical protein
MKQTKTGISPHPIVAPVFVPVFSGVAFAGDCAATGVTAFFTDELTGSLRIGARLLSLHPPH